MFYHHQKIEKKWQRFWEKEKLHQVKDFSKKKKCYLLVEFPYPSADGLHVGHIRPYVAFDILARKKRMEGHNVLYPMGWDAFGLPTENYAIKTGIHPAKVTEKNIKTFKRQLKSLGLSFDWSREINTTDPQYYKWTQWIFLKMFEKGLAYQVEAPINWCSYCKIGLANEEVIDGKHERCGKQVVQKKLKQWMLKITQYADRLIEDLDKVNFLEKIKTQQINWIGKSYGTEIKFPLFEDNKKEKLAIVIHDSPLKENYPIQHNKHWLPYVVKELEKMGYKVICREMPNANQPKFEEWEKTLRNISVDENTIIVGHSAGCSFAARWLTKNKKKINKLIFVAPSKVIDNEVQRLKEFNNFEPASDLAKKTLILYSIDDKERISESAKYYHEVLNNNEVIVFNNRGHFTESSGVTELPEIIDWIKKDQEIKVFTTRIDTIFGVTALVVAPEHEIILNLKSLPRRQAGQILNLKEVENYIEQSRKKSDLERTQLIKEKTGVKLKGIKVINPINNKEIPVWVGDYVVATYGGGAVMVVPAHDQRDFEFAQKYNLPIIEVVAGGDISKEAFTEYGTLVNSGKFNSLSSQEAIKKITEHLEKKGLGKKTVQYKLRDWIFSRQHYWGEPIPLVHCQKCGAVAVPEKDLPIKLPYLKKYQPSGTGESPLAKIEKWVKTKCPKCEGPARRETDTMPNWAGSNWYYLAYIMKSNWKLGIRNWKLFKYWMPVDWYNGGMEHVNLHLLYSRFVYKFLYDLGVVPTSEPYKKRTAQGMVLAEDSRKMSKSFGNVINPDEIVKNYGADTLRVYEMFMGPFDETISWSTNSLIGCFRFLNRIWNLKKKILNLKSQILNLKLERLIHKTIKKVSEDMENLKFNTAVAALMTLVNEMEKQPSLAIGHWQLVIKLLSPFVPHLAEELWSQMQILADKSQIAADKNPRKSASNPRESVRPKSDSDLIGASIFLEKWPVADERLVKDEEFELVIQINGKVRDKVEVPTDISENEATSLAKEREKIKKYLAGKEIKKTIFIPQKLINFVIE